jgi:ABC-type multidrug transport system fused ATPase/permease subunit
LSTPPEREAADATAIEDAPGALSFRGVTVRHPGTGFILGPVELEVVAGETIVLVGPSGSGKSTLLELVPRLADPDDGAILLDGVELSRLSLDSLRGRCALVPQEPYFFAGTIEENLTFAAPHVDRRALHLACRAAHVEEFVQRLPQGYATPLARGASNLSVGQRQRLAMARAMLVSPRILLLDEPTAALDDESEQLLVDALRAFSDGRTTIIASHAPRVLPLAHRIVRLVHGRVVGIEAGMRATPPHVRAPRPVTDA